MFSFEDYITSHTWSFSRTDGSMIAPIFRFLPDGRIGGHIHPNERFWEINDNVLLLKNITGETSTRINQFTWDEDGIIKMSGPTRYTEENGHVFERITMPSFSDLGQESKWKGLSPFQKVLLPTAKKKKNLVVLRAGKNSLHTKWERNIDECDKNWDLCLSWYDAEIPEEMIECEYFSHQPNDRKFGPIFGLFEENSPLWAYDNIWLPDDDLETTWADINRMFNIFEQNHFDIAQPSLAPQSYVNHPITIQNPEFYFRYTTFVEVMCPVFRRDIWKVCVKPLDGSISGFGLDHIWIALQGRLCSRVAIIDDVSVVHTRPMGKNYDLDSAMHEGMQLMGLCCVGAFFYEVGGLRRNFNLL